MDTHEPPTPDTTPPPTREEKPSVEEPVDAVAPKKERLEPTRYGDWELNGKCVDF